MLMYSVRLRDTVAVCNSMHVLRLPVKVLLSWLELDGQRYVQVQVYECTRIQLYTHASIIFMPQQRLLHQHSANE